MPFVLLQHVDESTSDADVRAACEYTARCLFFGDCGKAPLDVCQIMYAAHTRADPELRAVKESAPFVYEGGARGYKTTASVAAHPLVAWLCESPHNWKFMCEYARALYAEFDRRRGSLRRGAPHASYVHYEWLRAHPPEVPAAMCVTTERRTPIPLCGVSDWIKELGLPPEESYWLYYIEQEHAVPKTDYALERVHTPRPLRLEDPALWNLFLRHCPRARRRGFKYTTEQHGQSHQSCVAILEMYEQKCAARGKRHVPQYLKVLRVHARRKIRKFHKRYLL